MTKPPPTKEPAMTGRKFYCPDCDTDFPTFVACVNHDCRIAEATRPFWRFVAGLALLVVTALLVMYMVCSEC